MADPGNSTRSNQNESVSHNLRYAYVLIVPQQHPPTSETSCLKNEVIGNYRWQTQTEIAFSSTACKIGLTETLIPKCHRCFASSHHNNPPNTNVSRENSP